MKLIGMRGRDQVRTMASLHFTYAPSFGRAATLYLPCAAAAASEWQDLVVLSGLVALQHALEVRQRRCMAAAASGGAGGATG